MKKIFFQAKPSVNRRDSGKSLGIQMQRANYGTYVPRTLATPTNALLMSFATVRMATADGRSPVPWIRRIFH